MNFKYKLYSYITIFQIILILPTIVASNERCIALGGVCKDFSDCTGNYKPIDKHCDGSNNIKCCIRKIECPTSQNSNFTISGKNKEDEALPFIFKSEGGCQNDKNDNGNKINGKIGYTCAGITPMVGWKNKENYFSYAIKECTNDTNFTYCAYKLNENKFREGAKNIYIDKYAVAGKCNNLPQPAYYVCFDTSVNHGSGWSSKTITANPIGNMDGREYGLLLNKKSREKYINIVKNDSSQEKYLNGWLSRADDREKYCNNYCTSNCNCDNSASKASVSSNTNTTDIYNSVNTVDSDICNCDDNEPTDFLDDDYINNEEEIDEEIIDQEEYIDEEQSNDKKSWILVALGAVWSIIAYIFCCRYFH